jgi:hypothetical protein
MKLDDLSLHDYICRPRKIKITLEEEKDRESGFRVRRLCSLILRDVLISEQKTVMPSDLQKQRNDFKLKILLIRKNKALKDVNRNRR